jgi:hypothetical protein
MLVPPNDPQACEWKTEFPTGEKNSYLMALLKINVISPSHAISGMSKTSNMKDHLNQGRSISYIQEIYLKFFNNGTVHANFSVQTAVQICKSFIPFQHEQQKFGTCITSFH